MKKELMDLARKISAAGKMISKDSINKFYYLEPGNKDSIYVISDSGFESIVIGDTSSSDSRGYMYLYYNNTSKRNSYPSIKEIARLLEDVFNKTPLETGEGKAAYCNWEQYGNLELQREYFSEIVSRMAFNTGKH